MNEPAHQQILLDPRHLHHSLQQLAEIFDLAPDQISTLHQIIAFFPRAAVMRIRKSPVPSVGQVPLSDKFTFDIDQDELILFDCDFDTLVDALIEMAMYLAGFLTLMGADETWVIEFTIGAWKPVKKSLKRQLNLPLHDRPRGIVGLPSNAQNKPDESAFLFRTLVSYYDQVSFHQMVMLAARDDITVYFPPETHPKVLAVYVYMQRAIQEVGQNLELKDYQVFNTRLIEKIQQLQALFKPATLPPPTWLHLLDKRAADQTPPTEPNPFEAFIDQLLSDDDIDDSPPTP